MPSSTGSFLNMGISSINKKKSLSSLCGLCAKSWRIKRQKKKKIYIYIYIVYWSARAALKMYHSLGGLENRKFFAHSSRG